MHRYARWIIPAVFLLASAVACSKDEGPPVKAPPPVDPGVRLAKEQRVLRIGRIPFRSTREMVKAHEPITTYLENVLSCDQVQIVSATDYRRMAKLIENDQIDIAWMGTKNYLRLHQETGVSAFLRPVRRGKPYYGGLIIARADSGITRLSDLKGKVFAFVDKGSASGYLYPLALLLKSGIDPDQSFKEVKFLGGHDSVVYNVFLKKVDAGAVYDDARLVMKDPNQIKQLRVVAQLPRIPNEPIAISKRLSAARREEIVRAFLALSLKDARTGEVLERFNAGFNDNVHGFVRASDADYDVVRELEKTVSAYGVK
ncbi:MAG: phosphate/phosphite/phosphonate ABC transporter substrate-binding protein [Elusimicrobiota bacterium]